MTSTEATSSELLGEAHNRPEELPLSEVQAEIEKAILKLNGRIKSCGRSAYRHLRGAWKLHPIDSEMSLFRAITAEEEAATALILALKLRHYPGSDLLNHRDHLQKAAITPFLDAVNNLLAKFKLPPATLRLHQTDTPRFAVSLDTRAYLRGEEPLFGEPDEPLNFVMRKGNDNEAPVHCFEDELQEIATGRGLEDIVDFVRKEANLRNRLLYAEDGGYPTVSFPDATLLERLRRVTRALGLTIALQSPQQQLFAVQCLEAFLRALRKMNGNGYDFAATVPTKGALLTLIEIGDGKPSAEITYFFSIAGTYELLPVQRVAFPQ